MSRAEAPAAPRQPIIRETAGVVTVEPSVPPPQPLGPPRPVVVERTPSVVVVESPHLPPTVDCRTHPIPPEGILLPTYRDLPCEDGAMENSFDHAQSALLKDSVLPLLRALHPDGRFCVTHDTAIYFRTVESRRSTAVVPDWCYVPGLPMLVEGDPRPSFLTWEETVLPVLVLEYISREEAGERDRTPETGKFWIYEHIIRPNYYGIYDVRTAHLEVYRPAWSGFELLRPNDRGRYRIEPLGVELGVWTGDYQGVTLPWLRWFDPDGALLPTGEERADKLAAKLRELGVNPDQL
jgi:hypothetical protein